jgi:hypothetical protein
MLRISPILPSNGTVIYRLEGRIGGDWVGALRHVCEEALETGARVELVLSDVEFADRPGLALLRSLRRRGVRFVDCPPLVSAQLDLEGR